VNNRDSAVNGVLNPASQYCYFFDDDQFIEEGRPGFRRRVVLGEHLELWFWRITGGTGGSVLHHHVENEQIGIIMRGALDFRIGDPDDATRTVLNVGDVYLANPNVWHGDSNFIGDDEMNEVWILDVFSPPRTVRPTATENGSAVAS
jgi:quercetin dioxygenase-like cupin family protein